MSGVSPVRFILLNMAASAIWALLFASGGFLLGSALSAMIKKVERYEIFFLAGIAGIGVALWVARVVIARRRRLRVAVDARRREG
jgi:membrane protein DedA with SNARE-associated domain